MLVDEDPISSIGGSFGLWQAGVFLLAALVKVPSAWHMLGVLFKAPSVDFWCVQPKELSNLPVDVWINLSHPIVQISIEVEYHDPCEIYDVGYEDILGSQNYNKTDIADFAKKISYSAPRRPCQQFQYDNSLFQETVVTEWHLVCNRRILVSVSQFFYLFGILVGGLVATLLIPRTGPRWLLLFGATIQIIAGTATAFAPLLEINIALRFTAAFGCACMFTAGYIIYVGLGRQGEGEQCESFIAVRSLARSSLSYDSAVGLSCAFVILSAHKFAGRDITWGTSRTLVCAFYEWFWSFGVMSLPGLCLMFGMKSWRSLQIVISVPTILILIIAFFCLPESPRWLLENGKIEEAEKIVRRMAYVNGRSIPSDQSLNLQRDTQAIPGQITKSKKSQSPLNCYSWMGLFRSPGLGKMIALHILWGTTIVTYYGALLNVKNLGSSLFLNIFIAGLAEMTGVTFGALIILYKKEQKWNWLGAIMLAGGLSCAASWFLLFDMNQESLKPISYIWWHQWVLVALGMAGRIAIACSFTLLQLSSVEVIPSGQVPIGSLSTVTFARICLLSAPFIGYLVMYGECVSLTAFGSLTVLGGFASLLLSTPKRCSHCSLPNLKIKNIKTMHGRQGIWTVGQTTQQNVEMEHRGHFNQNFMPD